MNKDISRCRVAAVLVMQPVGRPQPLLHPAILRILTYADRPDAQGWHPSVTPEGQQCVHLQQRLLCSWRRRRWLPLAGLLQTAPWPPRDGAAAAEERCQYIVRPATQTGHYKLTRELALEAQPRVSLLRLPLDAVSLHLGFTKELRRMPCAVLCL